jgi:hypothetical protein
MSGKLIWAARSFARGQSLFAREVNAVDRSASGRSKGGGGSVCRARRSCGIAKS